MNAAAHRDVLSNTPEYLALSTSKQISYNSQIKRNLNFDILSNRFSVRHKREHIQIVPT